MSNSWKSKDMTGTFANGEGPVLGQSITNEQENKGLLPGTDGGPGKKVTEVSGPTPSAPPSDSDGLFDLHGKGYAGPGNTLPTNEGIKNPFDIGKTT